MIWASIAKTKIKAWKTTLPYPAKALWSNAPAHVGRTYKPASLLKRNRSSLLHWHKLEPWQIQSCGIQRASHRATANPFRYQKLSITASNLHFASDSVSPLCLSSTLASWVEAQRGWRDVLYNLQFAMLKLGFGDNLKNMPATMWECFANSAVLVGVAPCLQIFSRQVGCQQRKHQDKTAKAVQNPTLLC